MKKIFTLLAAVFLAGNAFGQQVWTNVVTNCDLEGDNEGWDSFLVHEWKADDMSERYDGAAEIVADPADPSNKCAKLYVRTRAEGEEAGNLTPDWTGNPGTYASWDCQFFIYAQDPIPAGKMVRLKIKVKGAKAGQFETQRHSYPGTYIDGNAWGNLKYDTEWTTIVTEPFTVSENLANSNFQSIAFNVSTTEDGNTLYFDDIKLQIKDPKEETGEVSWINFMRKGIYSDDAIKGLDGSGNPWQCTNFTVQDLNKPEGEQQQPAPVVEVPGEPGVYAVKVPVPGYYIEEVEDLDEEGNEQIDDDGNVKMKTVYYWNNGKEIGSSAPARWQCQFFVSTLHKMKSGERYKFVFKAKADQPSALGTQAHYGPGQFKDYNTFGSEGDFPLTTEWTLFELGEAQSKTVPSGANGCQTIVFDCVPLEGPDNTFYFIFEECSFTDANVTDDDRTLGEHEPIALVVDPDGEELGTTIDGTNMLNTFELEDFSFLESGDDGIKLLTMTVPEDPEDEPEPTFSGLLVWNDGGFIDAEGLYSNELETGISIRFDNESVDGNNVDVLVWNDPDSGITVADGAPIETKLAVSESGWYYVYDVTLMSPADYEAYTAGIKTIAVTKKTNGVIYDLMGRKVSQPTKGIYIKDGKKFIQK